MALRRPACALIGISGGPLRSMNTNQYSVSLTDIVMKWCASLREADCARRLNRSRKPRVITLLTTYLQWLGRARRYFLPSASMPARGRRHQQMASSNDREPNRHLQAGGRRYGSAPAPGPIALAAENIGIGARDEIIAFTSAEACHSPVALGEKSFNRRLASKSPDSKQLSP